MKRKIPLGFILALCLTALSISDAPAQEAPLKRGATYSEWFLGGQHEQLWDRLADPMRNVLGSADAFERMRLQLGDELALLDETLVAFLGLYEYTRTVRFEHAVQEMSLVWVFDDEGTIHGALFRPAPAAAESRFLDYETKSDLVLPFDGEWYVFWGGRTIAQNYHASARDQRFALDLVVVRDNRSHVENGSLNEHYHCFGLPILAPARGRVVAAVDGLRDNEPGVMDAANPPGNHVVIDHLNGEFSFLAHLQHGSVSVSVGEDIEQGEEIGRCGNSGNSSEPHLHYHLQNSAVFGAGEGLPAKFRDFEADGVRVERGEPVRGMSIRPVSEDG